MFNLFVSKVKNIFGSAPAQTTSQTAKPSVKVHPKPATKAKEPIPTNKDSNRVVFKPQSGQVAPPAPAAAVLPPAPPVPNVNLDRLRQLETDLKAKESDVSRRLNSIDEKEKYLFQKEKQLDEERTRIKKRQDDIDDLYRKQLDKLESISGLDVDKAKQLLLSSVEKKMADWVAKKISDAKEDIRNRQDEIAKELLTDALRHGVTDYVAEYTVSTITIPDEAIKGKIIGREGRNIRAFEKASGVELELDETNDIRISSFDSTRREIARLALEKLIKDGRIQPLRIEQLIAQTRQDMDRILIAEGKRICTEVGVFNLPIDLVKEVGKYKFRFSYGQNLAKHTIEATKIATALANELRADVNVVKLGTLLHDIGKVITDQEGTHIDLGVDLLRKFHLPEKVINAVAEHHEDKEFSSLESVLVYIGDAASGARPGARYEVHEEYLKRMTNIEEVAKSFSGVINVAAYQAGREVMVIVDPGTISDSEAQVLSQNISEKLEEEAKWAGQIKVTVIREFRTSSTIVGSKISKSAGKIAN